MWSLTEMSVIFLMPSEKSLTNFSVSEVMTWDGSASWIMPSSCAVCALRRLLPGEPSSRWKTWNVACDTQTLNWMSENVRSYSTQPSTHMRRFSVTDGWVWIWVTAWHTSINNELHGRVEDWCSNFGSAWGNVHSEDIFSITWLTCSHILMHQSYQSRPWLINLCKAVVLATWLALLSLSWACKLESFKCCILLGCDVLVRAYNSVPSNCTNVLLFSHERVENVKYLVSGVTKKQCLLTSVVCAINCRQ